MKKIGLFFVFFVLMVGSSFAVDYSVGGSLGFGSPMLGGRDYGQEDFGSDAKDHFVGLRFDVDLDFSFITSHSNIFFAGTYRYSFW